MHNLFSIRSLYQGIIILTILLFIPLRLEAAAFNPSKIVGDIENWFEDRFEDLLDLNDDKQSSEQKISIRELRASNKALSKEEADKVSSLLWENFLKNKKSKFNNIWNSKVIEVKDVKMKFNYKIYGQKPKDGWSLYISLHGGGAVSTAKNDQQWKNQLNLYKPKQGIYIAPRAPTDTWNLWHREPLDKLIRKLIKTAIVAKGVNPNKVYLLGYSAGGNGVYRLATRLADYFAASSAMAGHPGGVSPLNLYNLPFAIHVGQYDNGYKRNVKAREWHKKLSDLQALDKNGYIHKVKLHEGKGHWMDLQDKEAIPWMEQFSRNPLPTKIVLRNDDSPQPQFYWLFFPKDERRKGQEITAQIKGQRIILSNVNDINKIRIFLNDSMIDLDKEILVESNNITLFRGKVKRSARVLAGSFYKKRDPNLIFSAGINIQFVK